MIKPILYILIGLLLFIGYVRYLEGKSVFFPMKNLEYFPDFIGLAFEDVYIDTADNLKINGWFIPNGDSRFTLLFFHGNGGNIGHRLEKIKLLYSAGLNIFIIDYRGYGKSQGRPSERGLYLDARAAYDYLADKRNIAADNIILYGESLGGAVAIDLAAQTKVKAIIIEEVFTNIGDMAKIIYPILPAFLISTKFDSLSKVKNIRGAKLFIHSVNDEIVPFELGKKLYNQAGQPKKLIAIQGAHNNAFLDSEERYVTAITSFLKELD